MNHASKYDLEVNFVGGDPRLVFFDEYGTEVLTLNVVDMDAAQIGKELEDRGFVRRDYGAQD